MPKAETDFQITVERVTRETYAVRGVTARDAAVAYGAARERGDKPIAIVEIKRTVGAPTSNPAQFVTPDVVDDDEIDDTGGLPFRDVPQDERDV